MRELTPISLSMTVFERAKEKMDKALQTVVDEKIFAFSQKEMDRMERIYGESTLEPTDPEELRLFLLWKKQGSRGKMPEVRPQALDAFYLDIIKNRDSKPVTTTPPHLDSPTPSLAEATIDMMQKDDGKREGWKKAMSIIYGKEK